MAEQDRRNPRGKQPISRHPLFPVTVALWCGALLGLCSLAIPSALLESLVLTLRIDALIPAAAPPLGATARILLAVAMAGIGTLVGMILMRRLAVPQRSARETVQEAHDAETSVDQPEEAPRRRTLAAARQAFGQDADRASPPAGSAPQILDVADVDFEGFASESKPVNDASDSLEAAPQDFTEPASPLDHPSVEPQADPSPPPPLSPAAQRIASADLDELSHVELLERLALSMQRRAEKTGKAKVSTSDRQPFVPEDKAKADERPGEQAVVFPGHSQRRHARFAESSPGSAVDGNAPSAEQPDTEDGEKALRDALSALQRISGAR